MTGQWRVRFDPLASLSVPSFNQAHAAFEQEGLMGLVPKKREPRTRHKLGSEVMAFIEDQ